MKIRYKVIKDFIHCPFMVKVDSPSALDLDSWQEDLLYLHEIYYGKHPLTGEPILIVCIGE